MRLAVISVLFAALVGVPAQAETDFTKLGPYGFTFVGFGALPGGSLAGSVDDLTEPYVSTDRGVTWAKVPVPHPNSTVYAFLGSRTSPGTVWMGTAVGSVYISHDGGRTTEPAGQVPGYQPLFRLGRRGSLFVGLTGGEIARSTNLKDWRLRPIPAYPWVTTVSEDGVALEYGPTGAAQRSLDGGVTFAATSLTGFDETCGGVNGIGLSAPPLTRVYVVDHCGHAWRSADGGASYAPAPDAPAALYSVAIDNVNADIVYGASTGGMYRSTDGGGTWTSLPNGPANVQLFADPDRTGVVYGRTRLGLLRSNDGGATWTSVGPHITGFDFVKSVARASGALLAGTKAGLLVLRTGEQTWRTAIGLPSESAVSVVEVDPRRPAVALAVAEDFRLYRSDDSGATWHGLAPPGGQVFDIAFDGNATGSIWLTTGSGLVHTTDDGVTWDLITGTAPTDHVAAATGLPNVLFLVRGDGIYRSSDGGATAIRVLEPQRAEPGATFVGWVAADPYHPGRVLAQTGLHLARSLDGGATWRPIGELFSFDRRPEFAADGTIFAVRIDDVVVGSVDDGATWTPTPDPSSRSGYLEAPNGIALVPAQPAALAGATLRAAPMGQALRRLRVQTIYAASRGVVRARFSGALASVYLPRAPVLRAQRRSVRIRVICGDGGARYCAGGIVVRQHGRVVGRAPFIIRPTSKRVRAIIVTVALRGATRGAARLELLGSSPWRSGLVERRRIRLR